MPSATSAGPVAYKKSTYSRGGNLIANKTLYIAPHYALNTTALYIHTHTYIYIHTYHTIYYTCTATLHYALNAVNRAPNFYRSMQWPEWHRPLNDHIFTAEPLIGPRRDCDCESLIHKFSTPLHAACPQKTHEERLVTQYQGGPSRSTAFDDCGP